MGKVPHALAYRQVTRDVGYADLPTILCTVSHSSFDGWLFIIDFAVANGYFSIK